MPPGGSDHKESSASPRHRHVVARVEDVPVGTRLLVKVAGREIGVFNEDGKFYAVLNRCPHRGGQLCKGEVVRLVTSDGPGSVRLDGDKKFISCPWHGWEYDIETGQSWYDPSESRPPGRYPDARRFGIDVQHGRAVDNDISSGSASADADGAWLVDVKTHRVKGPYVAEMMPVDIEDDYIVITLAPSPSVRA